ncbi:hypothetical protein [Paenibacillus sp. FSL R5-0519]|uniref:hypothetical protein n=1 Tax=Paenibacillus sp. FSL R5-0519 TaxID=2921648 RepID=UPI0030D9471A
MTNYSDNVLPVFTSASPVNGVSITATPFVTNFEGWRILASSGNGWYPDNSVSGRDNGVIVIDLGKQRKIGKYTIKAGGYFPKSWTIKGSNTGAFSGEEELLSTMMDSKVSAPSTIIEVEFFIDNPKMCRYYKFDITKSVTGTFLQIAGLKMMEKLPENKILLSSGDGKYRSIKDNGVIYSDKAIIPISTNNNSNVTSDYTLSAGSSSDTAFRAIQGGTSAWQGTGWFRTVFVKKYKLGAYSIQAWSAPNQTPLAFRLMGSNDGVVWDEINNQSGLIWTANEIKIFPINASVAYTHYELRDMASLITPLTLRSFRLFEYIGKNISMLITESATEDQFIKCGTDTIAFNSEIKRVVDVLSHDVLLGSGKTFEHTVDMSKRRVHKITLG